MKNLLNIIFTFIVIISFSPSVQSQTFIGDIEISDESQTHIIMFKDGKYKTGRIISIENTEVVFFDEEKENTTIYQLSQLDKIMVKRDDLDLTNITARAMAELEEKQQHNNSDPKVQGNNRLLYTETGFALKRGLSEYHTIRGVIHTADYGLSNGITIGLGVVYPGYILGHLKFNYINSAISKKLRAGFDFTAVMKPEETETEQGWTGFLKMSTYFSYGTPGRTAHLGLSVIPTFTVDDSFDDVIIALNFGGTVKVAPQWKVIYENSFGGDDFGNLFGFFSGLGVQWFNEKNAIKAAMTTSPSFGFINFPLNDLNGSSQLPFVSYSRYF